jgi:hypothetical protein
MLRFGGGIADSSLNTPALILLAIGIIFLLFLRKRYIFAPLIILALMIPQGEQLVLLGLHFPPLRILLFFGWIRVAIELLRRTIPNPTLHSMDFVFVAWACSNAVLFVFLWGEWGAVIDRLGFLYSTLGGYLFFRFLVREKTDLDRLTLVLVWCSAIIAVCMLAERATGRNLFAMIGGVDELDWVRYGRIRAQGPFAHAILAGVFGATLLPLSFSLRWRKSDKYSLSSWVGMVAGTIITLASTSSTPLLAYVSGIFALCLWRVRRLMRVFRWGIVLILTALHLVMKAPVWALIARVDIVGGSSADHRYELVNRSIRHFSDWWLLGARNVSSWGYLMSDSSNQFMDVAITGGLLSLVFFIWILVKGFQRTGLAWRTWEEDDTMGHLSWCLGATLFADFVAFWGTAYFDQIAVAWYALLAMVAAVPLAREWNCAPVIQAQEFPEIGFRGVTARSLKYLR